MPRLAQQEDWSWAEAPGSRVLEVSPTSGPAVFSLEQLLTSQRAREKGNPRGYLACPNFTDVEVKAQSGEPVSSGSNTWVGDPGSKSWLQGTAAAVAFWQGLF